MYLTYFPNVLNLIRPIFICAGPLFYFYDLDLSSFPYFMSAEYILDGSVPTEVHITVCFTPLSHPF